MLPLPFSLGFGRVDVPELRRIAVCRHDACIWRVASGMPRYGQGIQDIE
jgi:hypothetical protein